jgi:serine/threonine protein kinase/tetratricopeptide (TPR) repeat protein
MNEEEIFHQALARSSPEERAAYLDQACAGDAAVRAAVEALLRANVGASGFLAQPVSVPITSEEPPLSERPGTVIGPYKLLERIGEGGFGVVFMAEQLQPLRRKVAVKVLKAGMDSRQVVARFEAERQALAILDHPNIARVFDGGATASGRPYFVMELVRGTPIIDFCDEHKLTMQQRLELFVTVCQAIQHAHQKGIIHRDLKPANVLVSRHDSTAVVKVIDFGVAKALGQELTDKTLFTGVNQMIGTPLYMSPEQAGMSDLDVDTRSDIYCLGVLLYELLTGTTPFTRDRFKAAAFDEIRRIIREEEPPRPSTRLSESKDSLPTICDHRRTEPAKLTKLLRGDLDWIVMKALEKDRNRRYETASGFARDIQCYLADEPVLACPPSAAYRLRKFARRNRTSLTMAALVVTALLLGIVATTWQAIRAISERDRAVVAEALARTRLQSETEARQAADEARQEALQQRDRALKAEQQAEANLRKARQAVDEYFTLVSESKLLDVPGLQPLRKRLLEAALRYYQTMLDQHPDDPAVLVDLALSSLRTGNIYSELDRIDDCLAAGATAIGLLERLRRDYPNATGDHRRLAGYFKASRRASAVTRLPKDPAAAIRTVLKLADLWEAFARENPSVEGFQSDLANMNRLLAAGAGALGAHGEPGAFTRSAAFSRKATAILEELNRKHPEVAGYRENLADSYGEQAWVFKVSGQMNQAREATARSEALYEELHKQFPDVPKYRALSAKRLTNLATSLATSQPLEAEKTYRQALEAWQKLATDFPIAPEYSNELAAAQILLANLLWGPLKRTDEALEVYRRTVKRREELAADFPEYSLLRAELGWSYQTLAERIAGDPKQTAEAQELRSRAQATFRRLIQDYPDDDRWPDGLAITLRNNAFDSWQQRPPDGAVRLFREAIGILEESTAKFPREFAHWYHLADTYRSLGNLLAGNRRTEEAEKALRRAIQLYDRLVTDFSHISAVERRRDLARAHRELGNVLRNAQKPVEAEKVYRQALAIHAKLVEEFPSEASYRQELLGDYIGLGGFFGSIGQILEAEEAYRSVINLDPNHTVAHNNLAWLLATGADPKSWKPGEAVKLAKKAVAIAPGAGICWNTLGAAQYRAGNWQDALSAFHKSMELRKGGDSFDWFFLAMANWKIGDREAAQEWYGKAVEWMEKNQPGHEELRRFRAEAAELMGIDKKD